MAANDRTSPKKLSKLGGAGMNFFRKLVFEENSLEIDNRRSEDRTPVVGEITVAVIDESGKPIGQTRVFVRDLSKQGCCLWSRVRFAQGTQVILHFPAANGQPPLARAATVCHSRGQDGAGFAVGCRFAQQSAVA
jgi:hypothetical protein